MHFQINLLRYLWHCANYTFLCANPFLVFQVPPAELEQLLICHPNVDDVAVIGVPDLEAGELPKAFVVRRGEVTEGEIEEFVAKKVPPQKKLRGGVEFVEHIPKSASGKILRRLLKEKENH